MEPFIPMTPDQLPQQRIYAVQDLPERPRGFICRHNQDRTLDMEFTPKRKAPFQPEYYWNNRRDESGRFEENMPRSARFLASVEWASSSMGGRIDAYYISTNRQRSHWLLWLSNYDDNCCPHRWRNQLWAYGPKQGVPEWVAAIYLLVDCWKWEQDSWSLDPVDWINGEGMLSVADLKTISKTIWPDTDSRI